MKRTIFLIFFLVISILSYSAHIKGGWIYYEYIGPGTANPSFLKYRVTVKVYRDCSNSDPSSPQNDASIAITVFNSSNNQQVSVLTAPRVNFYRLQKLVPNPCMSNPPVVCYYILQYETTVELAPNTNGYTLSFQRCCRISGIRNLQDPTDQYGNTYSTTIPGTVFQSTFPQNNTPKFAERDTAVVCFNAPFSLDYSATDADGDSLVYQLCPAITGGNTGTPSPNPSSAPPYASVTYKSPYSALDPFGTGITINASTGLVSGIAPAVTGEYVMSVCVDEYRNQIKIGTTRKELHISVGNCTLDGAGLAPAYITCDGFTMSFSNEVTSSNITAYAWNFGDPASGANNTSTLPQPSHTYTDSGFYVLKLKVTSAGGCQDSAESIVKVFPGFIPNFDVTGSCFQTPFQFTDRTTTAYGFVDSWRWNFGDLASTADTSVVNNPAYQYPAAGSYTAQLIVTNSKGCIDTLTKLVPVRDIPTLVLGFKDTLICSIDTLQLNAIGNGNFSWTPNYNIINPNTNNPLVYPKDTTKYIVTLNENGCIKRDTVTVNVLDFIDVALGPDTSMCRTDTIRLNPVSQALQYRWTPATYLNNSGIKNPIAKPDTTITYMVTANLGKCQDKDSITIFVTPYPKANAGADTSICFGLRTTLQASITGSSFNWTPTNTLLNANTLSPIAYPTVTTSYILSAFDTLGCPKPFRDTIRVRVIPRVMAFAGRDTAVVANQPLQLNATGGTNYLWTPTTGMNNSAIPNPIVILGISIDSITYRVRVSTPEGCFAEDDIRVKVFKTDPEIFVPSGFTPNNDNKNDVLRPILVGMQSLTYFRVYNRWGQLLYSTSEIGAGWDGKLAGKEQATGTFVYMAQATDYTGKTVFRKGTVVLLR